MMGDDLTGIKQGRGSFLLDRIPGLLHGLSMARPNTLSRLFFYGIRNLQQSNVRQPLSGNGDGG